jgi:hypothetical protein
MTSLNNDIGSFFEWLTKPMSDDDVTTWYLANNIIPEYTELFRDFCLSFLFLLKDTYLGDELIENSVTKIGMTERQKREHFDWCWKKTLQNFNKENIDFVFSEEDSIFFENFFFDMFYNQTDTKIKDSIDSFFDQMFNLKTTKSKADLEIFTDIYKVLERSVKYN